VRGKLPIASLIATALIAGAIISLQIAIMRVYAVGSWAHFGSFVVGLAMLGFGLASLTMSIAKIRLTRSKSATSASLLLIGPIAAICHVTAQQLPFNPIFLVSDSTQAWRLTANFLLYFLPFFVGALFLGLVFLQNQNVFNRFYCADLIGSGIAALATLGAMSLLPPERLLLFPLFLWALGATIWFMSLRSAFLIALAIGASALSLCITLVPPLLLGWPAVAISPYKGVSYARNFPDAKRLYRDFSPFGDIQIYSSSFMHFAPGLSDSAAFNVPEIPTNTYVGLYIDGEGPQGIMRPLPTSLAAYFRFLPMNYPYILKTRPSTFVVQFGGGISTQVALAAGADTVTIAEGNPAILSAFRDPAVAEASGDVLLNPRVQVVGYDGRLFLQHTNKHFDVIDLSLADSVGLSNPGGFAIVERYAYTHEAVLTYMKSLKDSGILAVTLWNKEEPPKSVLKLYATIVGAARAFDPKHVADAFYAVSSYLSTTTVLYKRGGFRPDEVARLRDNTASLSFDEIAAPDLDRAPANGASLLAQYRTSVFGDHTADGKVEITGQSEAPGPSDPSTSNAPDVPPSMPATQVARLTWFSLLHGSWDDFKKNYLFDASPLTNDRPYFAAYVRPNDLPLTLDRLDLFQDEWPTLLLWMTLAIAAGASTMLILIPLLLSTRATFGTLGSKVGTVLFFASIGLGYILTEVGLISRFAVALSNPAVSAAVLIAGVLIFSGVGSLVSERTKRTRRISFLAILVAIAALQFLLAHGLDSALDAIGGQPLAIRIPLALLLVAPLAFLMGFPMATGLGVLSSFEHESNFVWAWGINGCFSVVGATLEPIVASSFGLARVFEISAVAYLLAAPAFLVLSVYAQDQRTQRARVGESSEVVEL
jgi:hypothetical protein